jgi:hypothetical protein
MAKGREAIARRTNDPDVNRFRDFAERWENEKRQLAVRGKTGYERSIERHEELGEILSAIGE